jgi:hypothetical protein
VEQVGDVLKQVSADADEVTGAQPQDQERDAEQTVVSFPAIALRVIVETDVRDFLYETTI